VFAPLCQYAIGARFGPTGQQLTAGLPVATLALAAAAILLFVAGERRLPYLSWAQILFVGLVSVGLLGMTRQEWKAGTKELIQLAEIAVLAPFVFRAGVRRLGWRWIGKAFLVAFALLLVCRRFPGLAGLSPRKAGIMLVLAFPFALSAIAQLSNRRSRLGTALVCGLLLGFALPHGGLVFAAALALLVAALFAREKALASSALVAAVAVFLASVVVPYAHPWASLSPHRDDTHLRRGAIELLVAAQSPREYPLGSGLGCYQSAINRLRTNVQHQPHPEDNKVPRDGNCQYAVALVEAGPAGLLGLALFLGLALLAAQRHGVHVADEEGHESRAVLAGALAGAMLCAAFGLVLSRGAGIWVGGLVGLATMPVQFTFRRSGQRLLVCALVVLAVGLLGFSANEPSRDPGAPCRLNRRLMPKDGTAAGPLRVVVLPDPGATGTDSRVVQVEAEDATDVAAPFAAVSLGDASGGRGLVIPDAGGKDKGGARFVVHVPEDGTYVLYARVYWDDGCSNSLCFLPAGQNSVTLSSGTYERWHTLESSQPLTLTKGDLEVRLRNLEDGIRLDYWGLRPL
jgi:hypothetical protein